MIQSDEYHVYIDENMIKTSFIFIVLSPGFGGIFTTALSCPAFPRHSFVFTTLHRTGRPADGHGYVSSLLSMSHQVSSQSHTLTDPLRNLPLPLSHNHTGTWRLLQHIPPQNPLHRPKDQASPCLHRPCLPPTRSPSTKSPPSSSSSTSQRRASSSSSPSPSPSSSSCEASRAGERRGR